jgi:hypothetical protein
MYHCWRRSPPIVSHTYETVCRLQAYRRAAAMIVAAIALVLCWAPGSLAIKLKISQQECLTRYMEMYAPFYGSFVSLPDLYGNTVGSAWDEPRPRGRGGGPLELVSDWRGRRLQAVCCDLTLDALLICSILSHAYQSLPKHAPSTPIDPFVSSFSIMAWQRLQFCCLAKVLRHVLGAGAARPVALSQHPMSLGVVLPQALMDLEITSPKGVKVCCMTISVLPCHDAPRIGPFTCECQRLL